MRKFTTLVVALVFTIGAMSAFTLAGSTADEDVIKAVMKEAMKGGLHKKVVSGQASAAEKAELLKIYKEMANVSPEKGDAASWKSKTAALVAAAQAAVDGKGDSSALLKSAANCKACHAAHKGQ
jgi:hypothetical protein